MNIITMAKAGLAVVKTFAVVNAPIIFISAAAVGVVSTAVIAWKAGKKSSMVLGKAKVEKGKPLTKVEKVKATWKLWLPVCVSIILTFGCMGASYYIHSVRLAEMTATANALLVSNKELNKELNDLSLVVPEEVDRIKDKHAWDHVDKNHINVECGDIIFDEYLCRSWRMDINLATSARDKCIDLFKERGYLSMGEMYYVFGQKLRGTITNDKWLETWYNHNDTDYPLIQLKECTRIREDGEVETMWRLIYDVTTLERPGDQRISDLRDDITENYSYSDYNDDELMATISSAFA